jgi:hypothetical protein
MRPEQASNRLFPSEQENGNDLHFEVKVLDQSYCVFRYQSFDVGLSLVTKQMLFYTQIQTVAFGICTARVENSFKYAMAPTKVCGHDL